MYNQMEYTHKYTSTLQMALNSANFSKWGGILYNQGHYDETFPTDWHEIQFLWFLECSLHEDTTPK